MNYGSAFSCPKEGAVSIRVSIYKSKLVFGDEFLAQSLHLKSHQRYSAGNRIRLSADQSSFYTLTQ